MFSSAATIRPARSSVSAPIEALADVNRRGLYASSMRALLPLLLLAAPAAADPPPHSGVVKERTAPELSAVPLVAMAAAGLFLARRAMRGRFDRTEERRVGEEGARTGRSRGSQYT